MLQPGNVCWNMIKILKSTHKLRIKSRRKVTFEGENMPEDTLVCSKPLRGTGLGSITGSWRVLFKKILGILRFGWGTHGYAIKPSQLTVKIWVQTADNWQWLRDATGKQNPHSIFFSSLLFPWLCPKLMAKMTLNTALLCFIWLITVEH